jgi:DNA-binding PadR family transcriptional regulator
MLTPLEMFILALVREGERTPYAWQSRARVSLGGSLPVASRLVSKKLLTEKKGGGVRPRREFALTRAGEGELRQIDQYLDDALDQEPSDVESILRLACLAAIHRRSEVTAKLLLQAATEHEMRSRRGRKSNTGSTPRTLAELYRFALGYCEAVREGAIAESLSLLATSPVLTRSKKTVADSERAKPPR